MNGGKRRGRGRPGYALAWVTVVLILVGLIVGPLLLLVSTSLMSSNVHEDSMQRFYASDAGVEAALKQLRAGVTTVSPFELNGNSVDVVIVDEGDGLYKVTSTATDLDDGKTTSVESYVSMDSLDLGFMLGGAITSNGDVTIQSGSEITGDVVYSGDLDNKGTIDGNVTQTEQDWPSAQELADYYWDDVKDLTPFAASSIDVADTPDIGPLYRNGSLDIDSSSTGVTATLQGTVYVAGNLEIGQTNKDFTLDLNGHTIFAEGTIGIGGKCTITGTGCIIAAGDVTFQPNIASDPNNFVLVMSVEGTVTFQPSGDFYGAVVGNSEITLQPNCTLTWVDPGGSGDVDFPTGDKTVMEVLTYTITDT